MQSPFLSRRLRRNAQFSSRLLEVGLQTGMHRPAAAGRPLFRSVVNRHRERAVTVVPTLEGIRACGADAESCLPIDRQPRTWAAGFLVMTRRVVVATAGNAVRELHVDLLSFVLQVIPQGPASSRQKLLASRHVNDVFNPTASLACGGRSL